MENWRFMKIRLELRFQASYKTFLFSSGAAAPGYIFDYSTIQAALRAMRWTRSAPKNCAETAAGLFLYTIISYNIVKLLFFCAPQTVWYTAYGMLRKNGRGTGE